MESDLYFMYCCWLCFEYDKVDREGSLTSTCQPNILRPISQFKPAMPSFTPWCHTEAGICSTPHTTTIQVDIRAAQLLRHEGLNAGASIAELSPGSEVSRPRAGSIFKDDDCRVKQSLNPTQPHSQRCQ